MIFRLFCCFLKKNLVNNELLLSLATLCNITTLLSALHVLVEGCLDVVLRYTVYLQINVIDKINADT